MKHLNQLTRQQFLDKIYNYRQYPDEFVYIGTMPSMVVVTSSHNSFCTELEPAFEIMAKRHKNHYDIYYVDVFEVPDIVHALKVDRLPKVYLCPVKGTPTVICGTINMREISRMANKVLAAVGKKM